MNHTRILLRVALSLPLFLPASSAFAETIELVTYYPATFSGTAERFHSEGITVGDDPYSLTNPSYDLGGILLVSDSVGIGPVFGTAPPAGVLHVVGAANQGDRVLFMPGAGGTLNVGIGIAAPVFPLQVVRDQNSTVAAGAFSNPNAGNQAVTDLRVGQDVETNNGQYGALNYYGSGVPAGFQGYGNPNQVSLVAASGAVNGLSIATNANAPIKFLTNTDGANNERMRITGAGNVGIGNTYAPGAAVPNGAPSGNLDVNDIWLRNGNRWASQGGGGTNVVFRQGDGVQSGTNNAINETSTLTITLPAGTWVLQAHVQIHQSSARPLSLRINGAEVQSTDDSGTELEIITLFGIRQVVTVGAATVVPVTLVATSNFGLRDQRPVNFMLIATQVG